MSKLKELTWENHKKAERMTHARKLLKGMEPEEYHRFVYNQCVQYGALEDQARDRGLLKGIEGICRVPGMVQDLMELFGKALTLVVLVTIQNLSPHSSQDFDL